ncbi:helix-turn-helix transcriptional regulator [Streptomyces sp. NPDC002599]|uniref:helix-turn-helix domain-containing protein n=1 Tax=Streptomyces sp. NPDC002599 TaxID=3154421 RepID=UPI0033224FA6
MTPDDLNRVSSVRRLAVCGAARARRIEQRITLREMAAVLNVQPSTLSRWETGRQTPRGPVALKWSQLLSEQAAA